MYHTPRAHLQLRLASAVFVLLFLVAVGLLQWLSREYSLRFDLTQTSRHSLTEASIAAAQRLTGPVSITAYASRRDELRAQIQTLIGRYQRYKPDIALRFVDPDESPDEVRAAGVQHEGELLLQHADAKERIAAPSRLDEEAISNAFTRLGHRGERWIVFLVGHGERSPDRHANFDLSTWANELRKRGFRTRTLALAEHPQIPVNTSVFVIASPRAKLLPGETKEIQNFLDRGGNLLWLSDPGPQFGLEPLAETLGVEFLPGTAVDPASQQITGNATALVVANYGAHPVVRDFVDVTLFPQVGALHVSAPKGWQGSPLLETRPSAWLATGPLTKPLAFNKGKDIRGPLTIAVTLTRSQDKREQRVIVFADGDFLSNTFLGNAANLDLGMSVVNWLSQDDSYVSIPVRAARDRYLGLSQAAQYAIAIGFFFVLPLAAVGTGISVWWRRRKR